jgi:ABC-type nitrate/sulfonate/bicarbonate transport system substrate-binding protein
LNDETESVFDKIKYAYPQPKMTLQQEGEYAVVSYHDKVYYRLEGEVTFSWYIKKGVSANYPVPTLVMVQDAETERLLEGLYYNHIQVKKEKEQRVKDAARESKKWCEENPDKDPLDWLKPQTPEQVADGLKEAFREAVKQGVVSSVDKPQTLYDVIADWWDDVFTKKETSLQELVDAIEEWLPKEQSAAGSQNAYVECTVEGFNDCLTKIKGKLR